MGLWLFYCDASLDDIAEACTAAEAVLSRQGFTGKEAQDAAFDAADLTDETGTVTPNSEAVVAWFNAEDAAFKRLEELTGEWPHQAALIYTDEDDSDGST
ncbi:hypothetical protein LMG31884_47050 (plasmid) [Xanthomonas hydrangeae]|uniref:hypothetical protein n=1 Tax=Xanthomonas hydrangeae TaxID=2775159 RepID=UPI001962FC2C|nr:hypothetical protein LMG31884_47050 [Xanthomonas hydrangeae]CAD7740920.1 hypothetical protein LMG31884_47050 [Xanthomonas hydrangeae]CAD7748010.1 hypothetical protein LMG31887_46760 [Xanthomonas hydrangeae]CAD7748011.1 hypothetical protein LMG31887_46760 [Xanthomonas hydrangeae]CAD7748276.1 hypothetical protein LMG31885_45550 [Xanthomonas hydrangeae]